MVSPSFNRLATASLVLAAAVLLAGCGRKETKPSASTQTAADGSGNASNQPATSTAANPVDPAASVSEQEKARVAQAVAMREGKAPPPPEITLRGGEPATAEIMKAYNQQLAQLIFQRRDVPETLDELVRKWPMPKLPTPPAGKQILYDARYRIIVLYPP